MIQTALVDDKGQLQYAGNGGDDLSGLRTRLSAPLKTSRAKPGLSGKVQNTRINQVRARHGT
jgi:hypothetical protein